VHWPLPKIPRSVVRKLTLKAVNNELSKLGYSARLVKASSYFYFQGGEADNWLDKTISVPTISSHTVPEWITEFERLKKVNAEIMGARSEKSAPKRKQTKRREND
jgi:hypothetical protein